MWCNVRGAITFVRDDRSQNSSYLRPNYQTVSIRIYPHVGNGDETSIIVGTAQTQNWTVAVAQPPEPVICYDARSCNVRDDHICTGRSIAEQFVLTPELPNRLDPYISSRWKRGRDIDNCRNCTNPELDRRPRTTTSRIRTRNAYHCDNTTTVLLTKNGPLGTLIRFSRLHEEFEQAGDLTHLKFENRLRPFRPQCL
jgi:hypothetical protein